MKRQCRIARYLTAYADGELKGRRLRRVEAHLERCESCARELDSIRSFDRMLGTARAPRVPSERWSDFGTRLSLSLDRVDSDRARGTRPREARPVYGTQRRWTYATAGAAAFAVIVALAMGPGSVYFARSGNDCVVESIETMAAGYTPMAFRSEDPEMTVIWVFSEEPEADLMNEEPGTL